MEAKVWKGKRERVQRAWQPWRREDQENGLKKSERVRKLYKLAGGQNGWMSNTLVKQETTHQS